MKRGKGFTLIETIFAILLIGIILAIGFSALTKYFKTQKLTNIVWSVAGDIKQTMELNKPYYNKSVTSDKNVYIVIMKFSSTGYSIINQSTGKTVKSVAIPAWIVITTSFGSTIAFNSTGKVVFPMSYNNVDKGYIKISNGNASFWITAEGLGSISLSNSNPGEATFPVDKEGTSFKSPEPLQSSKPATQPAVPPAQGTGTPNKTQTTPSPDKTTH